MPAIAPGADERSHRRPIPDTSCNVLVLDTGAWPQIIAADATMNPAAQAAKDLLMSCLVASDPDEWDGDGNRVLDPAAGHGTFIAGIFANLAPGARVDCERALSSYGDTDDAAIAQVLLSKFDFNADEPAYDIVSMSFGGFADENDPPIALAQAIAKIQARWAPPVLGDEDALEQRVVFVASAGNNASCRPTWPASFENVIGVGALGPNGPAWFTNYGPWVNACAPGVDIVSTFFDLGPLARLDGDHFDGWAKWSGTSFSGPVVAAQIAWEWMSRGNAGRPGAAASWLLDRSGHFQYPGLGTVVNFA
jgi:subtilisin family serine protease